MMKRLILSCLLAACMAFPNSLSAQGTHLQEFMTIMNKLKALNVYHYETETHGVFPTGEKDAVHSSLYMDRVHKRLLLKTTDEVLLVGDGWMYRADLTHKTISIFNQRKYNDRYKKFLPEIGEVFKSDVVSEFLDSVVALKAKVVFYERKGDLATFKLGFPAKFYVQGITLVYNYKTGLPESIRINAFYAGDPKRDGSPRGTTYETLSSHYTTEVPESVFSIVPYFSIIHGKIILRSYKGYKVSSIL